MKTVLYPGSFNPFHEGHLDILKKTMKISDKIILAGHKKISFSPKAKVVTDKCYQYVDKVSIITFKGLLVDLIKKVKPNAIIRGLRNGSDLQYEMNFQYWNEDLGLNIPIIYFITDRSLSHISSSTIRKLECIKTKK